jgi:hypothetical protein
MVARAMFNLSVQHSPSYLLIVVSGSAGMAEFCASTSFLAELAQRLKYRKVLLDMLSVDVAFKTEDAATITAHLRQFAPQIQRLAHAVPAGNDHGILEAVCAARGIECQAFDTLHAAERWLLA